MSRMKKNNESGYTLTEIAVVLGIIGLMATLAVPSFIGIMPRIRLNSDAMILSNEIALARMRAISQSSDFRITFDPANNTYIPEKYIMTSAGPPQVWVWQSLGTVALNTTDLKSVTGFATANVMEVTSTGTMNVPLNTEAYVILQTKPVPPDIEGDIQKRITIFPTGRMKVERRRIGASWVED